MGQDQCRENALRVFLHQARGPHCATREGKGWRSGHNPGGERKNAAGLSAGDPAAPGRAVAPGSREEAGIPGTRRGREEENKSEVSSLQVSWGGEGEGDGTSSSGADTAK